MNRAIKEQLEDIEKNSEFVKEEIPDFTGVNKEDVFDLLYEGYLWKLKDSVFIQSLVKAGFKEFVVSFGANMVKRTFRPGEIIYLKGDTPKYFFIMETGSASLLFPRLGNQESSSEDIIVMSNSFFGEQELLLDLKKRSYTCMAKTSVSCFVISSIDFQNILQVSDATLREHFEELSSERQKKIVEILKMFNKCWATATHEIEETKLKNPLYRLRKILVSRKFREKYIEDEEYFSKKRFTTKLNLSKLEKVKGNSED